MQFGSWIASGTSHFDYLTPVRPILRSPVNLRVGVYSLFLAEEKIAEPVFILRPLLGTELSAKRLEILLEIAPKTSGVAMLWNDTNTGMVLRAREAQEAAAKLKVSIKSNGVHNLVDFAPVFTAIEGGRSNALLTLVDMQLRSHLLDAGTATRGA
jgi:hypothetical protein